MVKCIAILWDYLEVKIKGNFIWNTAKHSLNSDSEWLATT